VIGIAVTLSTAGLFGDDAPATTDWLVPEDWLCACLEDAILAAYPADAWLVEVEA
jgi:hypothetical protein